MKRQAHIKETDTMEPYHECSFQFIEIVFNERNCVMILMQDNTNRVRRQDWIAHKENHRKVIDKMNIDLLESLTTINSFLEILNR